MGGFRSADYGLAGPEGGLILGGVAGKVGQMHWIRQGVGRAAWLLGRAVGGSLGLRT